MKKIITWVSVCPKNKDKIHCWHISESGNSAKCCGCKAVMSKPE